MLKLRMVGLVLAMIAAGGGVAEAATVSQTTSYQADAQHSGGVTDPALDGPLQVLWTQQLEPGLSYPLLADGRAFVLSPGPNGSGIGDLVALDSATGRVLWRRSLQAARDLAYGDGMVYALNQGGLVVALDPATGVTRWANGPSSLGVSAVYAPPAFHDGTLYYNGMTNDEGSSVIAMDGLTGAVLWHDPLSTYDADGGVAVDDQGVYLGNECGYALSWTHAGVDRWSTRTPCDDWGSGFGEQTVVADGRAFTDFRSGAVLDTTTGAIVDEFVRPSQSSLPAFGAGHVAVLSQGVMGISDRRTLTTVARYEAVYPDAELLSQPFFVDDRVFSVDGGFHLIGVDAATATKTADVDLNGQVPPLDYQEAVEHSGGTAVGHGVIVVATIDGRLVAVTGPDGPNPAPPVDVPPTTTAPPTTDLPPTTDVPPVTNLPPVTDPPSPLPAPAPSGRPSATLTPPATPVRATAAAVAPAARRVGFPAGAGLGLVRRGLTLTIAGAHTGATVDAVLHAGGRVVWRAHATVPKNGRVRLTRPRRAIRARSAQLEILVRAPHTKTLAVRRTLR